MTRHVAFRIAPARRVVEHVHDRPVLVWCGGPLRLVTRAGYWTVPPGAVTWLPAWTRFGLESAQVVTGHVLFLDPAKTRSVSRPVAVLEADGLLGALLDHLAGATARDVASAEHGRLFRVLLDRITRARSLPLMVRSLAAPTLVRVLPDARQADGAAPPVTALAVEMGVSTRTVARAFARDVGMTAGRWRQQVRLTKAVALLAEGRPVHEVARAVGYKSASAFVAAFRRVMGTTPRRFVNRGR